MALVRFGKWARRHRRLAAELERTKRELMKELRKEIAKSTDTEKRAVRAEEKNHYLDLILRQKERELANMRKDYEEAVRRAATTRQGVDAPSGGRVPTPDILGAVVAGMSDRQLAMTIAAVVRVIRDDDTRTTATESVLARKIVDAMRSGAMSHADAATIVEACSLVVSQTRERNEDTPYHALVRESVQEHDDTQNT